MYGEDESRRGEEGTQLFARRGNSLIEWITVLQLPLLLERAGALGNMVMVQ